MLTFDILTHLLIAWIEHVFLAASLVDVWLEGLLGCF